MSLNPYLDEFRAKWFKGAPVVFSLDRVLNGKEETRWFQAIVVDNDVNLYHTIIVQACDESVVPYLGVTNLGKGWREGGRLRYLLNVCGMRIGKVAKDASPTWHTDLSVPKLEPIV